MRPWELGWGIPIAFTIATLVGGCATTQATATTDTFCISTRKIPWSVDDDRETIKRAEVHNRTIDRRCGYPGKRS